MEYLVFLEEMEGRWIAHVPALSGCFFAAGAREAALGGLPAAFETYLG